MKTTLTKIMDGYKAFRQKYAHGDNSIMRSLANTGQNPEIMIVSCCDSRVDPALIMQCDPGDLFIVRNVANIVPPYEKDEAHHGTSAALEFGICYLNVKHLIILGHSQCGGINAVVNNQDLHQNDFISRWVSLVNKDAASAKSVNDYAKKALNYSYENCLTFPWIKERVQKDDLSIHLWFFNIEEGEIFTYSHKNGKYHPLEKSLEDFS